MAFVLFFAAAACEIAGCYWIWRAIRHAEHLLWLPGLAALLAFAALLALTGTESAGRAFAAYGGVYLVASIIFMVAGERVRPDLFDMIGLALALAGAAVIYFAPRAAA